MLFKFSGLNSFKLPLKFPPYSEQAVDQVFSGRLQSGRPSLWLLLLQLPFSSSKRKKKMTQKEISLHKKQ